MAFIEFGALAPPLGDVVFLEVSVEQTRPFWERAKVVAADFRRAEQLRVDGRLGLARHEGEQQRQAEKERNDCPLGEPPPPLARKDPTLHGTYPWARESALLWRVSRTAFNDWLQGGLGPCCYDHDGGSTIGARWLTAP